MRHLSVKEKSLILWADLVDLGIYSALENVKRKTKSKQQAIQELKRSLSRQSQDHWEGFCRIFKRLK